MKTKKINLLEYDRQLKEKAVKMVKDIEDDNNLDKYAIYRNNCGAKCFKTTYTGADICWAYIYELYCDILDIFEDEGRFATKCKKAKDYVDNYLATLEKEKDEYFEFTYEDWIQRLEEDAAEEDREITSEDINIENFYENIGDMEWTSNYEEWNNKDETLYMLTEQGEDWTLPSEIIYLGV